MSGLYTKHLTLSQTCPCFFCVCSLFINTAGKAAISPSPTLFFTRLKNFLPSSSNVKLSSANTLSLEESKICHLGQPLQLVFLQMLLDTRDVILTKAGLKRICFFVCVMLNSLPNKPSFIHV